MSFESAANLLWVHLSCYSHTMISQKAQTLTQEGDNWLNKHELEKWEHVDHFMSLLKVLKIQSTSKNEIRQNTNPTMEEADVVTCRRIVQSYFHSIFFQKVFFHSKKVFYLVVKNCTLMNFFMSSARSWGDEVKVEVKVNLNFQSRKVLVSWKIYNISKSAKQSKTWTWV